MTDWKHENNRWGLPPSASYQVLDTKHKNTYPIIPFSWVLAGCAVTVTAVGVGLFLWKHPHVLG